MNKISMALCAFPLSLSMNAQTAITSDVLSMLEKAQPTTAADRALRNVVSSMSISKVALDQQHAAAATDTYFSLETKNQGVTNQESSGRCWLFTGLNVLRHRAAQKIGAPGLMFSQMYGFFYDQLEKSNLFLQGIIDTRTLSLDDRTVDWLFQNPLSDGGTYTGVADLVSKYGLVPQEVMAETYAANHTDELNSHLKRKLREFGIQLREKAQQGASQKQLEAEKVEMLKTIYHMLTLAYGEPVKKFEWAPKDANGKIIGEARTFTPLEFYRYCCPDEDLNADYVMLMNDPSRDYNKVYEIEYDRHLYDGHNWLYLNLPIEDIKPLCIASIKDSLQMYFSCDVGKQLNRNNGLLDLKNYDYESIFGTKFGMNKKQRIQSHDSGSSHAMTLMAVDLDANGKPTKWKVENSWGASYGFAGHLIMTDEWFDEYMFRVVVNKKYLSDAQRQLLKQKPVRLPAWDPMFMEE
ncbi:MAG: C1 family peptidase [Bacteroidales bacterium]|nr:C1 family peptidase [Candidatus Physcousia equi]